MIAPNARGGKGFARGAIAAAGSARDLPAHVPPRGCPGLIRGGNQFADESARESAAAAFTRSLNNS